jgi:mono/diheme cytochrome c family protein
MSNVGKRLLKIVAWVLGSLVALILILVLYIQTRWDAADGRPIPQVTAPMDSATIARGEYIYKFQAQCWGCHQETSTGVNLPPKGGRVFDLSDIGPGFGKWYSPNITPDHETGIGGWTDGQIVQALREGLNFERATLFPIMPIDWYHGMSDEDILSVVAYLRSLPPVHNQVPKREVSFITKALFTFGLMKPKEPITTPVSAPPRGITPEYGGYVARNLAGCADCHTPRNLDDGQFYLDSLFAGSSFPFGGGKKDPIFSFARNITPDRETGIGGWTEEQFINAVTMGVRPDSTVLTPHMPYPSYKSWTMEDLQAVYLYLQTVPPIKRTVPPNRIDPAVTIAENERGAFLFRSRCEACHGENGSGAQPTNVKMAEVTALLTDKDLMDFISGGQMNLKMPLYKNTLSEDELRDVIAFIRSWEKK